MSRPPNGIPDEERRGSDLRRSSLLALIVIALAVMVLASSGFASLAFAQVGASDGGDTIRVGVATPASAGGTASTQSSSATSGAIYRDPCSYHLLADSAGAELGLTANGGGHWYLKDCPTEGMGLYTVRLVFIPAPAATTHQVAPDPGVLASQAANSMRLPAPSILLNPPSFSVVNLPTWLWVDHSIWHSYSTTASAGGLSATAVAVPVSVSFDMGDGGSETCLGPGVPYDTRTPAPNQGSDCQYEYKRPSVGQPSADGDPNDGAYQVSATVTWAVSWFALGAPGGGHLPPLHTRSTVPVRVEQVESVEVGGQ